MLEGHKYLKLEFSLQHISQALFACFLTTRLQKSLAIPKKLKYEKDYFGNGKSDHPYYFRPRVRYHLVVHQLLTQLFPNLELTRKVFGVVDGFLVNGWVDNSETIFFTKTKASLLE